MKKGRGSMAPPPLPLATRPLHASTPPSFFSCWPSFSEKVMILIVITWHLYLKVPGGGRTIVIWAISPVWRCSVKVIA